MEWLEDNVLELIEHGYSPCTPLHPTLAVSLDMLEFAATLLLHIAPNERAWAETIVVWLFTWLMGEMPTVLDEAMPVNECPLCFGGNHTDSSNRIVQLIVCIDGNFQLKQMHDEDWRCGHEGETGTCNPAVMSPTSIILLREYLKEWEKRILHVQELKSLHSGQKCRAKESVEDDTGDPQEADEVEQGLYGPNLTYDACQESFIAADEDHIKASMQYFEDTGMMALLKHVDCRRKQFYVFALMQRLLDYLPSHWRVGTLYDISCQMDQSLKKWNFMPEWQPCLEWGVSIFHAYGHQWGCQLWYHPQKSELWGLSDGEGCERFWSKLWKLIPGLQTKGAHAIDQIMSLNATLDAQRENLKDVIAEGNGLVQDDSSVSILVQVEWQEKVRALKGTIQCLENVITKKTEELRRILDQKTKAHVEKAVKGQSGGIEATVKKYNRWLKELAGLRGKGGICKDAYIPPLLSMEGLYKLDVDQDIWEDSRGDMADFPDGVVPPWLANPSVKEEEYSAANNVFMGSEDEEVSYFALIRVHQLYDWMMAWKKYMVHVPTVSGMSVPNMCAPLPLQQHCQICDCVLALEFQDVLQLCSCQSRGSDDPNASSDDSETGELEEFFEVEEVGFIAAIDQAILEDEE
ncbi:hypothetical protein BS47DRAFT_1359105 [Hydnum rufescens UP504]|uniref:Uncharacterized protein n=1 Tax=Hydnum rufescens UP504 TaxID=1448309 RepID=A0A9P6B612_9AGAM|nr:hypothetical protein BS47DRAFT_1359105 [Hydnum rufescens UP504]